MTYPLLRNSSNWGLILTPPSSRLFNFWGTQSCIYRSVSFVVQYKCYVRFLFLQWHYLNVNTVTLEFVRKDNFSKHQKLNHNNYHFNCNDYGKSFNAKTQLIRPMKEHIGLLLKVRNSNSKRIYLFQHTTLSIFMFFVFQRRITRSNGNVAFSFYSQHHKLL